MLPKFRLCLIDMNHGHPNQAMRCFKVLLDDFYARIKSHNPRLEIEQVTVQPRNLHELPPDDCDVYLSSGGPGGPFDHDGDAWLGDFRGLLDRIVDENVKGKPGARSMLGVCYTYELLIRHFEVARMVERETRKFGVMPVYMTPEGSAHRLTGPFGERLFAFEHRHWEAVDLDERKLKALGGALLAQESRDGVSKGAGLLAFDFAPGIMGTQFHPEADKGGVVAWLRRREQAASFIEAYGAVTYQRMINTLDNPQRLARTFSVFIPAWLTRKFNALAPHRGYEPLDIPTLNIPLFAGDAPSAAEIIFHSLLPQDLPRAPQLDWDETAAPVQGFAPTPTPGVPDFDPTIEPTSDELVPLQRDLDPAELGEGH